jgi:hypothetical protein
LDLRVEGANTDPRITTSQGGKFFYWEGLYHDAYLNKSNLIGSWIGREGKGVQAWSTYWFSPRCKFQLTYRGAKVDKDFISGGESITDFGVNSDFRVAPEWEIVGSLQYERWRAPVLAKGPQSDLTTSIQVTYWPKWLKKQ